MYIKAFTLIKRHRYPLALLLIGIFLPLTWFKPGKIIGGGEEGLSFYNPAQTSSFYEQNWYEIQGGGSQILAKSRYPIFYLLGVLHNFNIPSEILQISLFSFISASACLGMYLFCRQLHTKSKHFSVFAALFYIFNTFTFANIWHRFSTYSFFFYALLPLSLFTFISAVKRKKLKYWIVFILISEIFSYSFSSPSTIITLWSALLLSALSISFEIKDKKRKFFIPYIYFLFFLITWCISSWWWLKYLTSNSTNIYYSVFSSDSNLQILRSISQQYPLSISLRLAYPSVLNTYVNYFTYLTLIPIFIGLCLSISRKKYLPILFFISSIFVLNGSHGVLGLIFEKIFVSFSFLQVFRNPYEKYGLVLSVCYSILFAWGVIKLISINAKVAALLIFSFLSIFVLPEWKSPFGSPKYNSYVAVPSDYQNINAYLYHDNTNYRVLDLPLIPGDGASNIWPGGNYYGLNPTEFLINKPVFSRLPRQGLVDEYWKYLRKSFFLGNLSDMAQYSNIKYLLLHSDMDTKFAGAEDKSITLKTLEYGWLPTGEGTEISCQINVACKLDPKNDYSTVKFISLVWNSPFSGPVRADIQDSNGHHLVFNGEIDTEYQISKTESSIPKKFIFDLRTPSELYHNFDLSHIVYITFSQYNDKNSQANLSDIVLDSGQKNKTIGISEVYKTPLLTLYKLSPDVYKPRIYPVKEIKKISQMDDLLYSSRYPDAFITKDININTDFISKSIPEISVLKVSSSEYHIKTSSPNNSYWLVFSDSFHPNWHLSGNNGNISHFLVNIFTNGFFVTPEDGTNLTLKFIN